MDYKASKHFDAARLVLEEEPNGELLEYMNLSMTLYLAPHQTIDIYAGGQMCVSQKIAEKDIGVDTVRYYLSIDGRDDEIKTGGDGYWGRFEEYYRQIGKDRLSDAVILTFSIPEEYDFEGMKVLTGYFFEELRADVPQKQKKKEDPAR